MKINFQPKAETLVLSMVEAGVFEIDTRGRIWRVGTVRNGRLKKLKQRRRAEYVATNGYLRIRVMVAGERVRVSAHRVVYRYFYGDIPTDHVVDHWDTDRANNSPENLEAVTQSENLMRIHR